METTKGKSLITVRNVLKFFAPLCFIIVFCPTFMVSCSGKDLGVSVMTAINGVSLYGDTIVAPNPIMILCLLIPAVIFAVLFVKTIKEMTSAAVIAGCGALDLVLWIIFRVAVQKIAEENLCNFKTTPWFVINIISLVVIILLSGFVLLKKLQMDSDLLAVVFGWKVQEKIHFMSSEIKQAAGGLNKGSDDSTSNAEIVTIGFCPKCGSAIEYDNIFCTSCGARVPQSMIDEAETVKKEAEERARAAEIEVNRLAEERARQEEAARKAAEEKAKQEEADRKAAEEKARQEEAARREAEERARQEEAARRAEEARARQEEAARREVAVDKGISHDESHQNTIGSEEEKPVFCIHCGAKLLPDSLFCGECGTKVE